MARRVPPALIRTGHWLRDLLIGPQLAAFVPAASLAAFWFGGETALVMLALAAPFVLAVSGVFRSPVLPEATTGEADGLTGLPPAAAVTDRLDRILHGQPDPLRRTAALALEIDDYTGLIGRHGHAAAEEVLRVQAQRLTASLRDRDTVARAEGPVFAIALSPAPRLDLETLVQLSARLQTTVAEPVGVNRATIYVTASVGFCLSTRAPEASGTALLAAARIALDAAKAGGGAGIRAYSKDLRSRLDASGTGLDDVALALETGEIRPWFQPQLSTDTGEVTGFEALARWHHRERGTIAPADFLPLVERAGLEARLGEIILFHALTALKAWRRAGHRIGTVSVNVSERELRNPRFVDHIRWELDRFDLPAASLTFEILETVIAAAPDDSVVHNIAGLSALGCGIDLDDFGSGQAALANLRRFAIQRIKIDRSFVTNVDRDREQQSMVAAILSMAEQLDLATLGEGVETVGEHAMLSQLGCTHVQGFSIARPMPFEDTLAWLEQHRERLRHQPVLGNRGGASA